MNEMIYEWGEQNDLLSLKNTKTTFMLNKLLVVHGWAAKQIKKQFKLPNSIVFVWRL